MSKASREWKEEIKKSKLWKGCKRWDSSKKAYMQICRIINREKETKNKKEVIKFTLEGEK